MASRKAKKVYLGVCVAPQENTSENTIYLSEAFSLANIQPERMKESDFGCIHDFIVKKDQKFSEEKPLLHLLMVNGLRSVYLSVSLELTQSLYTILRNTQFLSREYIDSQNEEEMTPILQDVSTGPKSLGLIKQPANQLTPTEFMYCARELRHVDFLTPFNNQQYFLATTNYLNFAIFKFNESEPSISISQLENSEFNLNSKNLAGITQIGDCELVLVTADGSAKTLKIKDPNQSSNSVIEQSAVLQNICLNQLEKTGKRQKYLEKKLLGRLAELEYDFDQEVLHNHTKYGEFSESKQSDLYTHENDVKDKGVTQQLLKQLEDSRGSQGGDKTLLKQEKDRLTKFQTFEDSLKKFKSRETETEEYFRTYRDKINKKKKDIQNRNDDQGEAAGYEDPEILKDGRWDPLTSAFYSNSTLDDFGEDAENQRSRADPDENFKALLMAKYYKEIEIYREFHYLAKEEISCIASFSFKVPRGLEGVFPYKTPMKKEEISMPMREAEKDFKKKQEASMPIPIRKPEKVFKKKQEPASLAFEKNSDDSEVDIDDENQDSQNKSKKSVLQYDVLVCATRGHSLRDGLHLVFYLKERSSDSIESFKRGSKVLRLRKLLGEVEDILQERKTLKIPKKWKKDEKIKEGENNSSVGGESGHSETHSTDNISQSQGESTKATERASKGSKETKANSKNIRPFQPFTDIESMWVTQLSEASHPRDQSFFQFYQMNLVANYKDPSSETIFKRLISFSFKIGAKKRIFATDTDDIFSGLDYYSIEPGTIRVINKYHKKDFCSIRSSGLVDGEDGYGKVINRQIPPIGTIDRLGVMNLNVDQKIRLEFVSEKQFS